MPPIAVVLAAGGNPGGAHGKQTKSDAETPRTTGLQVKRHRQNELPRVDDAVGVRGAVGIGGDGLESAPLLHIAHVQLETGAHLVGKEPRAIGEERDITSNGESATISSEAVGAMVAAAAGRSVAGIAAISAASRRPFRLVSYLASSTGSVAGTWATAGTSRSAQPTVNSQARRGGDRLHRSRKDFRRPVTGYGQRLNS